MDESRKKEFQPLVDFMKARLPEVLASGAVLCWRVLTVTPSTLWRDWLTVLAAFCLL